MSLHHVLYRQTFAVLVVVQHSLLVDQTAPDSRHCHATFVNISVQYG